MDKPVLSIIIFFSCLVLRCNSKVICINEDWRADTIKCRSVGIVFNNLNEVRVSKTANSLQLRDCNVAEIDGDFLSDMQSLQELDLSMNILKTIRAGVFNGLTNLKSLNLSKNMIHSIENFAFNNMDNLEELDLSFNYLKVTGKIYSGKALRFLDFSYNLEVENSAFDDYRLKTLLLAKTAQKLADTYKFDNLEYLDVSENRNMFGMGKMNKQFEQLANLAYLNVAYTDLAEIDIVSNANLLILNVSGNSLQLDGYTFRSNTKLIELDLCSNKIDALPDYIFDSCTEMIKLHLCDNKLVGLSSMSFINMKKLKSLDLSKNRLITVQFPYNAQILTLDLSNNRLTIFDDSIVQEMNELNILNLNDNVLSFIGAGLIQKPELEYLYLRCNDFVSIFKDFENTRKKTLNVFLRGNPWNCACIKYMIKGVSNIEFNDERLIDDGYLHCIAERSPKGCNVSVEKRKKWLESLKKYPNLCESRKSL